MSKTTPLIDFFGNKFIIPHYQRGYRWEEQEVSELLDDLWSFCKTSNNGEFYCLQPIVLQQKGQEEYIVLDGQQRLTTLYLVLVFLEERRFEDGFKNPLFTLDYETRSNCSIFLTERKFIDEIDESNIDFYHICQAYSNIKKWFEDDRHRGAKGKLVPILMDNNEKGNRNIRFIKYIVDDDVNPIDVFIRLNVGKIPLTDAELTKSLLLQSDRYSTEELQYVNMQLFEIASEWDNIEYRLQDDDFWYFLNNETNKNPTHIEFILDLIASKINNEKKYFLIEPTKHSTFLILSEYLQDMIINEKMSTIKSVKLLWNNVTEYFEYFSEWFNNRKYYHFIGYLISVRGNSIIDTLIDKSKRMAKKDFEGFLVSEISKIIKIIKKQKDINGVESLMQIEDLKYEHPDQKAHDRNHIHQILLLHNVYSTFKSDKEKGRFPFNLYKKTKYNQKWSLEHIQAQNSENVVKHEHRITWLRDHIASLNNSEKKNIDLISRMNILIEKEKIENEDFDDVVERVYEEVNKYSGANENADHGIVNLCLVDAATNSQLNNSVFDVKREIIKLREGAGYYIPVCTRNVFLKAYTAYTPNNAYWTARDKECYLADIKSMYNYFVKKNITL